MNDPLLAYRSEFPILERTTYLVSNSLGAMPRAVPDRLAEYVDQWAERGVRAWADSWWEMPIAVGNEIAPLIGASPGEVVMFPNVTTAQTAILTALEYEAPRNMIVMTGLDFPSVRYVYDHLATRLGARIHRVDAEWGRIVEPERIAQALKAAKMAELHVDGLAPAMSKFVNYVKSMQAPPKAGGGGFGVPANHRGWSARRRHEGAGGDGAGAV